MTTTNTCPVDQNVFYKNRAIAIIVLMATIAGVFWFFSRYPVLMDEFQRANDGTTAARHIGAMTKTETYPVLATDTTFTQIQKTTLNWIMANRIGMTFGIVFGGAFIVLLTILAPFHAIFARRGVGGAALGMLVGMPLGICANCVAPVGAGAKTQGMSMASSLAMMIASPTMNPIAFVILFTLFPWPVAALRVVGVLALILVAVPIIAYICEERALGRQKAQPAQKASVVHSPEDLETATIAVLQLFLRKTLVLAFYMIPLMLLGGFIGAVAVTFLPVATVATMGSSAWLLLLSIVVAALLGAFLPVPVFAELVFVAALWQIGVDESVLVTLLITLPATSVFSFFVLWRYFSRQTALWVFSSVVVIGILAGLVVLMGV